MRVFKIILVGLTAVISIAATAWFIIPFDKTEFVEPEPLTFPLLDTTRIELPETFFGYVVDSFDIIRKTVKRNEFLANILRDHNIDQETINQLVQRSRDVFDIRKIGIRKPYDLICYNDEYQTAKAMI